MRERAPAGGGKSRSLSLTRAKRNQVDRLTHPSRSFLTRPACCVCSYSTVNTFQSLPYHYAALPPVPGLQPTPVASLSGWTSATDSRHPRSPRSIAPRPAYEDPQQSDIAKGASPTCRLHSRLPREPSRRAHIPGGSFNFSPPEFTPGLRIAIGAPCASRNRVVQTLERVTTSSRASPGTEWRRRQMDPQRTTAAAAIMRPLTASRGRPLRPRPRRRRVDLRNRSRGEKAAGLLVENLAHDTTTIARNRPWSVRGGSERRSERAHPVCCSCVCVDSRCRLTSVGLDYVGRVKLAKHKVTGQYAAVKIVPKPRKKDQDRANKVRSQQRDLPPSKKRVC